MYGIEIFDKVFGTATRYIPRFPNAPETPPHLFATLKEAQAAARSMGRKAAPFTGGTTSYHAVKIDE